MSKWTKRIGGAVCEIVGELLLTLIFFGVGALVIALVFDSSKIEKIDSDLTVLIGVAVFLLLFAAVVAIVKIVKRLKNR